MALGTIGKAALWTAGFTSLAGVSLAEFTTTKAGGEIIKHLKVNHGIERTDKTRVFTQEVNGKIVYRVGEAYNSAQNTWQEGYDYVVAQIELNQALETEADEPHTTQDQKQITDSTTVQSVAQDSTDTNGEPEKPEVSQNTNSSTVAPKTPERLRDGDPLQGAIAIANQYKAQNPQFVNRVIQTMQSAFQNSNPNQRAAVLQTILSEAQTKFPALASSLKTHFQSLGVSVVPTKDGKPTPTMTNTPKKSPQTSPERAQLTSEKQMQQKMIELRRTSLESLKNYPPFVKNWQYAEGLLTGTKIQEITAKKNKTEEEKLILAIFEFSGAINPKVKLPTLNEARNYFYSITGKAGYMDGSIPDEQVINEYFRAMKDMQGRMIKKELILDMEASADEILGLND